MEETVSSKCKHIWVLRKGGYAEQCEPAVCLACNKHACRCALEKEMEHYPNSLRDKRLQLFYSLEQQQKISISYKALHHYIYEI